MDKIYKTINFVHPQLASYFEERFAQANINTLWLQSSEKRKILQGYYELQFVKCTDSSELKKEKFGFFSSKLPEGSVNNEEK